MVHEYCCKEVKKTKVGTSNREKEENKYKEERERQDKIIQTKRKRAHTSEEQT